MSGRVPRKNHNFVCVPGETKVVSVVKSFCTSHLLTTISHNGNCRSVQIEFGTLVDELRKGGGWEVRREPPSGAYLHVSLPQWGDEDYERYSHRDVRARTRACRASLGCPYIARAGVHSSGSSWCSRASRRPHRGMARKLHDTGRQQFYGV